MTKIARDARAFAQRVKMGSKRLWLIVEGRAHDSSFYDRVLNSHAAVNQGGYSIRLVEQIEVQGKLGGGKSAVYALHDFLETEDCLVQYNRSGSRSIAFAVDRDYETIAGTERSSPFLLYTRTADVESEILTNGDVRRAISSAYSLSREGVDLVLALSSQDTLLASELAIRWQKWITLGVASICCGLATDIKHSNKSKINGAGFDDIDTTAAAALEVSVMAAAKAAGSDLEAVQRKVEQIFEADRGWMLVKGKWLASFVWFLVTQALPRLPREKVTTDTLVKTCLETVDFDASWADFYRRELDVIVNMAASSRARTNDSSGGTAI